MFIFSDHSSIKLGTNTEIKKNLERHKDTGAEQFVTKQWMGQLVNQIGDNKNIWKQMKMETQWLCWTIQSLIQMDTCVTRLVKHLTRDFGSGHDLMFGGIKPHIGLCAGSTEPNCDSFSPSICAPTPLMLSPTSQNQ